MLKSLFTLALMTLAFTASFAEDVKPLKILLITGGCCHDYKSQKDILKNGIEARVNAIVDQMHVDDKSTKPPLPLYGNPDYAKGYDLIIHDECSAGISDPATIAGVLKPHQDGIPGVNLHCAMHSYRFGDFKKPVTAEADNGKWYEYLGLQSSGHGPQKPIDITYVDKDHPISKGLPEWTTINEELYNNISILGGHPLARGAQIGKGDKKEETVVVWTNEYTDKKVRVFSTSLGHNNATVEDARYLDLVARGVLWATGHLSDDGKATDGYGK